MSLSSRSRRRATGGLLLLAVAALLAVPAVPAMAEGSILRPPTRHRSLAIETVSTRADLVTGGDALISVRVPATVRPGAVRVLRNGDDVTGRFTPDPDDERRLVGLVNGLELGANTVTAEVPGRRWGWFWGRRDRTAELEITNHPTAGPLFSGPQQTPFICRTEGAGLGPALDEACSAPTRVEHVYRSTDGTFKDLPDPAVRPADLARTTTREGRTVDYVVRVESGTLNRAVYRWAVLAEAGRPGDGWEGGLVAAFGGGCGTGYHQGDLGRSAVLDDSLLSQGFAVASSSLQVFQTACNDVLSAETALMVKERLIETLQRAPRWTMGTGGSGGAIQQLLVAQNHPGILDGLVPALTFQDSQLADPADCRLLNRYFSSEPSLTADQRAAIAGYRTATSCTLWDIAFADSIVADRGCSPVVPAELIYDRETNPGGARCTVWDSMVNVYGRDPATGFARRTLDNVGVTYGLDALRSGAITLDRFLDLNERIGGYDDDGNPVAERSEADIEAIRAAYRTGRLALGGSLSEVPILDVRPYTDDVGDLHTSVHSFVVRERLRQAFGDADNQVIWRGGGAGSGPMFESSIEVMADWLDALVADRSRRAKADKVVDAKPAEAVDACWTPQGERIDEPAAPDATGRCAELYPVSQTTRMATGASLANDVLKCRLRPIDPSDYGSPSPSQVGRLRRIFPDGVCDWAAPGVGVEAYGGPWQRFDG